MNMSLYTCAPPGTPRNRLCQVAYVAPLIGQALRALRMKGLLS